MDPAGRRRCMASCRAVSRRTRGSSIPRRGTDPSGRPGRPFRTRVTSGSGAPSWPRAPRSTRNECRGPRPRARRHDDARTPQWQRVVGHVSSRARTARGMLQAGATAIRSLGCRGRSRRRWPRRCCTRADARRGLRGSVGRMGRSRRRNGLRPFPRFYATSGGTGGPDPRHEDFLSHAARDTLNDVFRKPTWQPGTLSDEISKGGRLSLPNRDHVLFRGGVSAHRPGLGTGRAVAGPRARGRGFAPRAESSTCSGPTTTRGSSSPRWTTTPPSSAERPSSSARCAPIHGSKR